MDASADRDTAATVEAAPSPDLKPEPSGLPLPAGVSPARRILDTKAIVTGDGPSSCSRQDPPSGTGDRWCGFAVPAAINPEKTELWVMDVSRAAAGDVPRCDGSSPACLRLTANLWTGASGLGPSHPTSHAFDGDTLIFYADAAPTPSTALHRGPVYAWRPGWSRPRQISSPNGFLCVGHPRAAVAYCLDDVVGDPDKPDGFELRAGSVADEAGGILPPLGRVRPFRSDGKTAWQVGFSPTGDLFAVSSPDPDPVVETLRVVPTADIGRAAPREVLRDVDSWAIASDGRAIYFQRDTSPTTRDLYVAAFPSGENITKVASSIDDYTLVGSGPSDLGVAFLTTESATLGAFRLLRDPRMPTGIRTVFTFENMLEDVVFSSDGRLTVWRDNNLVARVVRNDDLASCVLNTSEALPATAPRLLTSAGLVFWTQNESIDSDRQDGFVGVADTCTRKRQFARGVYLVNEPVGDRGLIFADEHDPRDDTVTLKYASVTMAANELTLDPPVRIRDGVRPSSVVLVGQKPLLLLFQRSTGGDQEQGTYVFGPVPF